MNTSMPAAASTPVTRRTLAKAAAWATPVLTLAAAAPAVAASNTPPGLQGYVYVAKQCVPRSTLLSIDGSGSYPSRGLWVYNTTSSTTVTNASITFYYPSDLGTLSWSAGTSNSGWSVPTVDSTAQTISGFTAYTTRYTGAWQYVGSGDPTYTYALGQPNFAARVSGSRYCGVDDLPVYANRTVTVGGSTISFRRGPVYL